MICEERSAADRVDAVEPADLARGAIAENVSVIAAREQDICLARKDLQDTALPLGEMRLGLTVARDVEQFEADFVQPPGGIGVSQRKIAVNAAFDLGAFGAHTDCFSNGERAVFGHLNGGIETLNDFSREHTARAEKQQREHQSRYD